MSRAHFPCRTAAAVAFAAAAALAGIGDARAQSGTFGTDQRYCDNSALGQALSTSKGNLIGSAAGGALGGLVGNQFGKSEGKGVMTALGVIGGALAGGYVGRTMDPTDQGCVAQSLQNAPPNQPVAWQNPSTGSSYWVTPRDERDGPNGEKCRTFVTDPEHRLPPARRRLGTRLHADARAAQAAPAPERRRALRRHRLQGAAAAA
jgi:surface antigen